ncbi:MAG: Asp-tRNA(Asn)/Glu-tRNA(Gln) amidotransferase subunit GatB [Gemmatimonadales bacterium]
MTWETVIGLEVHVQLRTASKMFCACATTFGDPPNTNVCPVCLGLPGALPAVNAGAVRLAVKAALALDFTVHPVSEFSRKNYFYPDLPKGYQISQFDRPLATGGRLLVDSPERGAVTVGITRLHLEEDAGKSFHDRVPGATAVDFNRSGMPLIEIVSEPDLRSPAEARAYLVALKQVLAYLDVSDCNMEEGSLRVDGNLSVRRSGAPLGTRREIKNVNSFAALEKVLERERTYQIATLEGGETITQATISANIVLGSVFAITGNTAMRTKEQAHDYRYFPEPDLPLLDLARDGLDPAHVRSDLPELPRARRARFVKGFGLTDYDAGVLTGTTTLANYFEAVVAAGAESKAAANWVTGAVLQDANKHGGVLRIPPERVAALARLVADGVVSHQAAKRIVPELAAAADPQQVAERLGLLQVGDTDQLATWVDEVCADHPDEVARYRGGETKLMAFFTGQVMKRSRGKADPKVVGRILAERLG